MKLFHIYDNIKMKITLISSVVLLENLGLLVNSTCGAQTPVTIYEEVIVKMGVGLNIVCSCQDFFLK